MKNASKKVKARLNEPSKRDNVHHEAAKNPSGQLITPPSLETKYRFVEEIGHGAQGRIFKAIRLADNKTVVIKQLNVSSIKTWKEYELFHREAEVLASLKIKGVAAFYDAIDCLDDEPPCSYIVQEYIEGVSLKKMLDDGHRFKVKTVYDILIQTLQILDKLHHHDPIVIHRDIKPSNLMISPDDKGNYQVTIVDFGAVANPQVQGGGSTVAGTYGYMPPEQLMGKPEPASDVYALAAVGVQLFSGKSPADIPTKDFRLIFEPEMQDKPHALVTTLRQMLEPKIENRLTDISEIIQRFKNYQDNQFGEQDKNEIIKLSGGVTTVYNEKLDKLRYICQAGSIDIWQELPDVLPRPIPTQYYDILFNNKSSHQVGLYSGFNKKSSTSILIRNVFFVMLFTVSLIGIVVGVIFFLSHIYATENSVSVIFISLILTAFSYVSLFHSSKVEIDEKPHQIKDGLTAKVSKKHFEDLLKSGRKSIGTITKIEFLPFLKNNVDIVSKNQFICHEMPAFKVQYKFNPPDDRRSEDLVHEFITHVEPENHYGLGDPLPILYHIENKYFFDEVYSMPYPVPLDDITHFEYLVGMSASNMTVESSFENDVLELKDLDLSSLNLSRSVKYSLQIKDYCGALRMIGYASYNDEFSYPDSMKVVLSLWRYDTSQYGASCINCLFEVAYPYKIKLVYRNVVLHTIAELIRTRPIPANISEILERLFVNICCSASKVNADDRVESYDNHEFDEIWEALIDLYLDENLSVDNRLTIIEGFKHWSTVESARKFYHVIGDRDFPNKENIIYQYKTWYRFNF